MSHSPSTSRRQFLTSTSALAAAALAEAARAQPATSQPGSTSQPEVTQSMTDAAAVTPNTIEEAEKLAAIEFTPRKRETIARTIAGQIRRLGRRQSMPLPPNDLAPALTFDPRLPGMKLDHEQRPLGRTTTPSPLPSVPTSDEDIAFAPLTLLARWIEARKLTSRRLTDIYLQRLRQLDPKLKFVITLTEELAQRQAERADAEIAAGKYRGPLHGIPWGAKDLLDTAGIRTTWGAEPYVEHVPTRDATVVKKLEQAGAVLVAKTTLGALAYGDIWHGGRTNNPWNPKRGSSGSSAGSASATAAGCIAFGIGTETLGSIVSPSRTCGCTGLRPTFGRVSRAGAMALCWSLDKIGPLARCVEDCGLVLAAINGADADDPSSLQMPFNFRATMSVNGLRVGYLSGAFDGRGMTPAHKKLPDILKAAGCELVEFSLPQWPYDTLMTILECEAAAAFEELTRTGKDDTLKWQSPEAWPNTFRRVWFIPAIELVQAHRFRRQCMTMMMDKFANLDAIIDPTNGNPLLLITNNTGHPSLTLRVGFRGDPAMPVSVTLIGRLFDEGTILRLGMLLEEKLDVWSRRPVLG